MVAGARVLDLGCGCGSASIAALMGNVDQVLINDIDPCKYVIIRTCF